MATQLQSPVPASATASTPALAVATAAPAAATAVSTPAAVTASASVLVPVAVAAVPSTPVPTTAATGGAAQPHVLRSAVDSYLRDHKIYDQIRSLVATQIAATPAAAKAKAAEPSAAAAAAALSVVERTVVDDILQNLWNAGTGIGNGNAHGAASTPAAATTSPASTPAFAAAFPAVAFNHSAVAAAAAVAPAATATRRYMRVRVFGARAFVDHISSTSTAAAFDLSPTTALGDYKHSATSAAATAPASNPTSAAVGSSFVWVVASWGGMRFESRPVAATIDPAIDTSFDFPLQSEHDRSLIDMTALLTRSTEPVEVSILRSVAMPSGSTTAHPPHSHYQLVAVTRLQWRQALVHGTHAQAISLTDATGADDLSLSVGMIQTEITIYPLKAAPNPKELAVYVEPAIVSKQLSTEKQQSATLQSKFHSYAKAWLLEYEQLQPTLHPARFVKVVARTEAGDVRCVSTFIERLKAPRVLDSSLHALRFVRLLDWRRASSTSATEVWCTPRAFLNRRSGDHTEHSLLLCSLLLGFGLDAYVALGTKDTHDGMYSWVITRTSEIEIMCWDAITGQRHIMPSTNGVAAVAPSQLAAMNLEKIPYRKVHCLFNDRNVWANIARDDRVLNTDFSVEHVQSWKAMNPLVVAALTAAATGTGAGAASTDGAVASIPASVRLRATTIDITATENAIESELRDLIAAYRTSHHQTTTVFDDEFSYVLAPSLSAYEVERVTGIGYGNAEFQHAIKRNVPTGYVFKAVPLQFNYFSAEKIVSAVLANASCVDALSTRNGADDIRFGCRVKIFPYAENVCAVWVITAVRFKVATK